MNIFSHLFSQALLPIFLLCLITACQPSPEPVSEESPTHEAPEPKAGEDVEADVSDPVVFVNGEAIEQADLDHEMAIRGAEGIKYQDILTDLIDQKILAQEALRRGLDKGEEAQRRLTTARERILGNILMEHAVDEAVAEENIRRLYQEQKKLLKLGDEIRAHHILVATREEAQNIRKALTEGENFERLAREKSLDNITRTSGGDLGYFKADTASHPFADMALSTPVGEISEVFETEFGWHILRVDDRREEQSPSLDDMRGRIINFLTFEEIQNLLENLQEKADITYVTKEDTENSPPPDDSSLKEETTAPETSAIRKDGDRQEDPDMIKK